jgi:orotate phosphoribosyltransferase
MPGRPPSPGRGPAWWRRQSSPYWIRESARWVVLPKALVGPLGPEDRVAVVEDTTTTGTSLLEAVDALAAEGIGVVQAVILVDRSDGRAAGAFAERGIPYRALLLPADLGVGP